MERVDTPCILVPLAVQQPRKTADLNLPMDMSVARPGVADPKHTSTAVVYGAKYQFELYARQAAEDSDGAGDDCNQDLSSGASVSTECGAQSPSEVVTASLKTFTNTFSFTADSYHDSAALDISSTRSSTPDMTSITTSSLPNTTVSPHSGPVGFDPPAIPLASIITSTTSVMTLVTPLTSPVELSSALGSTSNVISSISDGIGPFSTTHFNDATPAIPSVTKKAASSSISTSLSSGIPTGTSSDLNSGLHPVLSKGEIVGIFVGVGFAIVIAAISALYVYRRVRASKSNRSPPSSNSIIDDTQTMRSRNTGSIDPYRIEEYLRTSWHEDVATLRKFNMNGP